METAEFSLANGLTCHTDRKVVM